MLAQSQARAHAGDQAADPSTAAKARVRDEPLAGGLGPLGGGLVLASVRADLGLVEQPRQRLDQAAGIVGPARPADVDLADRSVAVARQVAAPAREELVATLEPREALGLEEGLGPVEQPLAQGRVRAGDVGQISELEVHLRGHVALEPAGEIHDPRIVAAELAQPLPRDYSGAHDGQEVAEQHADQRAHPGEPSSAKGTT